MRWVGKIRRMTLLLILIVGPAANVSAEYIVRPGDVLEFEVTGISGVRQRLLVTIDGTIRVPLIGSVTAGGKNLDQISELVQSRLASKSLRQMMTTGQEYQPMFEPAQILISIAEYRPVYLSGDVSRPGQQSFRPGLTVRQAVSLAGGYDVMRFRVSDPFILSSDLKAEHTALLTEIARENMRILRIRSELAGAKVAPSFAQTDIPLPPDTLADLASLEADRFNVNKEDYAKEVKFLQEGIRQSAVQISTVTEQQTNEREGLEADKAELDRLIALEKRGTTTSLRVTDARRSLLLSSTRYLQTTTQIAQFSREQADFERRLHRLDDQRKSELIRELQDSLVRAKLATERIKSVFEKLVYTGAARTTFQRGAGGHPTITIVSDNTKHPVKITGSEDTELHPGDVVEVELNLESRFPNPIPQDQ